MDHSPLLLVSGLIDLLIGILIFVFIPFMVHLIFRAKTKNGQRLIDLLIASTKNPNSLTSIIPVDLSKMSDTLAARQMSEESILKQIRAQDENFSANELKSYAREVFIKIQESLEAKDELMVRAFEGDELYAKHQALIQSYRDKSWSHVMDGQELKTTRFTHLREEDGYTYLQVTLEASLIEYAISPQGHVMLGMTERDNRFYQLTFCRKAELKTQGNPNAITRHCPNCQAPTNITSAGACDYCGSVVTTGNYGWVLVDYKR